MQELKGNSLWFVAGAQELYGEDALKQVAAHAKDIVSGLNESAYVPVHIAQPAVLTNSDDITALCDRANADSSCIGLVMWMHTFSPARMWMAGLETLDKPFVHLHTQHNKLIPWSEIDMDFMNLNQSAHGGREFGYMCTRLGYNRKVITGHWQDERVQHELDVWTRAAAAWHDAQGAKVARFGDNMRNVAVTEGDKVEAQRRFGYVVNGYGLGDLTAYTDAVNDAEVNRLVKEYEEEYQISESLRDNAHLWERVKESARIELGMKHFLQDGNFKAFTTTFENLHGLQQLPGLAVQRLMAEGYGFGAEGDWKTAALLRALKVMGAGLEGGDSFMEDYIYHFEDGNEKVLGAHMLEVCSSLAGVTPSLEVHPLDIGGKEPPARLVFDVAPGTALNATLVDLGDRFRMVVNDVNVVEPDAPSPNLPVARAFWQPCPDLKTAATGWILAGGGHHTGFSQALTADHLTDFAEMADVEMVHINNDTRLAELKKELRWNAAYYGSVR